MIRVALDPLSGDAAPQVYVAIAFAYTIETGHLELTLRDGRLVLGLTGQWLLSAQQTAARVHTVGEAERIHTTRGLVVIA